MNIKNLVVAALVAAGTTLVAVPAYAQMKWQGFYVGGGIGQSKVEEDSAGITSVVLSRPGVTSAITSVDDTDTGWKLFAGYQFNQNFAVEVGYVNLGKFSTFTTVTPFGTVAGEVKMENNWFGDVVGIFPLGNNFSVFGRVGLVYSETKVSGSGTIPPGTTFGIGTKDDDFSWKFGLGLGYDFTPQWGVRGEWERYRVSDGSGGKGDADLFSVSVRFKF